MLEGDTFYEAFQDLVFNTTDGVFVCGIDDDNHIEKQTDFLRGRNVTTANVMHGEEVFVTFDDKKQRKVLVDDELELAKLLGEEPEEDDDEV